MMELGKHLSNVAMVISTGRTGTMAIARQFNAPTGGVVAEHEPRPSRRFRILSNMHMAGRLTTAAVARALLSARRDRLAAVPAGGTYLESNPFLYGCIDALNQVYPRMLLIHVVRHPEGYIPSHINHGVFTGLKGWAGRRFPYWLLKPDYYGPGAEVRWAQMAPEVRLAWLWRAVNEEIGRHAPVLRERYLRLRYEDLFADGSSLMSELGRFIGVPPVAAGGPSRSEKVNASKQRVARSPSEWDSATRDEIYNICTPLLNEYGYTGR